MQVEYDIVKFCSIECKLQMSGELSVGNMVDGFIYAQQIANKRNNMYEGYAYTLPTVTDVLELGKLVEPYDNALGFRTCGVRIGYDVKMDWMDVPRQMVDLMEAVRDGAFEPRSIGNGLSTTKIGGANSFFKTFEEIHCFLTATAVPA